MCVRSVCGDSCGQVCFVQQLNKIYLKPWTAKYLLLIFFHRLARNLSVFMNKSEYERI